MSSKIKWYNESFESNQRYACVIVGVGVIAIEHSLLNECWIVAGSHFYGEHPLDTLNIEEAKTKAFLYVAKEIANMFNAINEAVK